MSSSHDHDGSVICDPLETGWELRFLPPGGVRGPGSLVPAGIPAPSGVVIYESPGISINSSMVKAFKPPSILLNKHQPLSPCLLHPAPL
jgi:hypothetical protein